MTKKLVIVDYGLGNIVSAEQSFKKVSIEKKIEAEILITNKPSDIADSTHIVLPGQGAFKSCMQGLKDISGMIEELNKSVIKNKKPFLGICVGMQLLADHSLENGKHDGLGWIGGTINKLPSKNLKLPHMGWNTVNKVSNTGKILQSSKKNDFYFVHNYYFDCNKVSEIAGITNYGIDFPSFISKENIYGVQFHPEKSSEQGLGFLENFLKL